MLLYSIYSFLAITYLIYRYAFLFIPIKKYKQLTYSPLVTIVIPTYNEDPKNLKLCINSVIKAKGNKEIFIVDDGSKDEDTKHVLKEFKKEYPYLKIHFFEKNMGKRKAHEYAFTHAKGEYIITIDSDTIVEKDAFIKLIAPMADKKVGAVTGNIDLLNKNDNMLTRMISARYWNAFNFERNSLSKWNIVTCCSGPLSAYRKEYVMPILKEYSDQMFLGKPCTYGDDRALTRLLLKDYDIVFVKDAVAHTYSPNTFKGFLKQQLRWKKSWIRETYLTSKFMFKRSKILSWEIFITTIMPILGLFVRATFILSFILFPISILYYCLSISIMAAIRNLYMLFKNYKEFIWSIPYAFIHEGVIFWLYIVALFTLKDTKWGTR